MSALASLPWSSWSAGRKLAAGVFAGAGFFALACAAFYLSGVFFLLLNLFKVPFMVHLGLINASSFTLNLMLAPLVLGGAWFGRKLVLKIDQQTFENIALGLSLIAGVKLLWG